METRVDAELLLRGDERPARGRLYVFFGYAPGVGKTYAMLKAAQAALRHGADVVVGCVDAHRRAQTAELLAGLETLPAREYVHNGIRLQEFDLDGALARAPQLLLLDELAHSNAPGGRHKRRCQDVEELLAAGIDVYTTVNVSQIESLNDMVTEVTGQPVHERVPDKIFDAADQVKLVDIEPQELIERLTDGRIWADPQARKAALELYTPEKLTALRELALRRCADRVNRLSDAARSRGAAEFRADEHILVCLSSSPSSAKIIRNAARMARAFHGRLTALFVETPEFSSLCEEDRHRLRANIHLAQQLGAAVETTYGEDVALQIAEFARLSGVSKIVVGRSSARRRFFLSRPSLTERLIAYAPDLDVYVIPDEAVQDYPDRAARRRTERFRVADVLKSLGVLAGATALGFWFEAMGFKEANIITVYILGVLITAILTGQRIYSLAGSLLSVIVFNFFFTAPRYTLKAYDSGYTVTFLVMFVAAFLTGTLADKLQQQAHQSARTAYRTRVLLDTNQMLQQAGDRTMIVRGVADQLIKLLHRSVVFYPAEQGALGEPEVFAADGGAPDAALTAPYERETAAWVGKNNRHAGATTATLSDARCMYLAVRVLDKVYGVVGIEMGAGPLDAFESSILLSIVGEGALALESEQAALEKEQAAVLAKNEQLRANLLRSISHDLRTPLTSISGSAGILLESSEAMTAAKRRELYSDIYDDSLWLINLVENLLAVTRIEDGTMHLKRTAEMLDEVIDEAMRHIDRNADKHQVSVHPSPEFLLVRMDAKLIMQVVINIVDNAVKYTPEGSHIAVTSAREGEFAVVTVADDGPGIPDEAKPHIFDMFYTAQRIADSRRSLGLGLALCRSILSAHGGAISVSDNTPQGTVFRFTLPIQEVQVHE